MITNNNRYFYGSSFANIQNSAANRVVISRPVDDVVSIKPSPIRFGGAVGNVMAWFFAAPKGCGWLEAKVMSKVDLNKKITEIRKLKISPLAKDIAIKLLVIEYLSPRSQAGFIGKEAAYRTHCKELSGLLAKLKVQPFFRLQEKYHNSLENLTQITQVVSKAESVLKEAEKALGKLPQKETRKIAAAQTKVEKAHSALASAEKKLAEARENHRRAQETLKKLKTLEMTSGYSF